MAHLGQMRKYRFDNQFVFFDDDLKAIKVLNPVAVQVVDGVNSGLNEAQIVDDIHKNFEVDHKIAEADVRFFLDQADTLFGSTFAEDDPYVPTTDYLPTRKLHNPISRCYYLPGYQFAVASEVQCLHALLSDMFLLQAVDGIGAEELQVSVFDDGNRYPIVYQGRTLDTGFTLADTAVKCLREINGLVAHSRALIAIFHAAAVSRDNKAVLMPAQGGSGKSTLAAYLMHRGFEYINDDAVPLLAESSQLLPVPVGLSIKTGSWPILAPVFSQMSRLRAFGSGEIQRKYLAPLNHQVCHTSVPCRLLVLPQYQRTSSHYEFHEVSKMAAFETIMRSGCTLGQPSQVDLMAALLDWLSAIPCYALTYSSLPDAEQAISHLLSLCDGEIAAPEKK
jgi:hypothetical protein